MDSVVGAWNELDARTRVVVLAGVAILTLAFGWQVAFAPDEAAPVTPRVVARPAASPGAQRAVAPVDGARVQTGSVAADPGATDPGAAGVYAPVATSAGTVVSLSGPPRVPAPPAAPTTASP